VTPFSYDRFQVVRTVKIYIIAVGHTEFQKCLLPSVTNILSSCLLSKIWRLK